MTASASRWPSTATASPTPGSMPRAAARRPRREAPPSRSCAAARSSTRRGSARAQIAAELGGLSPGKLHAAELAADALARALGAAARARGRLPRAVASERNLVAMSGGVDSAVAALLCSRRGETIAVTLELWSDSENDAEQQLLLGLGGLPGALDRALDRAAALHGRPPARSFAPAWSSRSSPATRAVRRRTRASGATVTSASTRCSSSPIVSAATAWQPATTRGSPSWTRRRAAAPGRGGPGQGPDLHALGAVAALACADAVPARGADEARGQGNRRVRRSAGRVQGRLTGSLLPRGHRPRAVPRPARGHRRAAR